MNIANVSSKLIKRPKLLKKLDDYFQYKLILIRNMPFNIHIIISSRNFIDLELAKLRISESILEINENELIGLLIEVKILSSIIYSKLENEDEAFREVNCAINLSLKEKPIQVYLKELNLI